ncbi:MAG: hypothetical protein GPJ21_20510 [Microcystis aeruginosa W13-11]|nr:hypothetical protein [Microcystis aeruginosa W13-11]
MIDPSPIRKGGDQELDLLGKPIGEILNAINFPKTRKDLTHIPHPQLSQIKKAIKVVHNN